MNREIKLRFWNSHLKAMYYENGNLLNNLIDEGHDSFIWALGKQYKTPKDITIQQFTGFTDRNGKEIYEGDIFKSGEYKWEPVEFENGQWQVNLQGARIFSVFELFDGFSKGDHPVVIGNMFENPELL
jgi:uncharacterized phage protein (TIGR01671 family)